MSFCSSTKKSVSFVVYLVRILAHLFFTAAHFHLALVVASISYFLTAATKLSCCSLSCLVTKKCLLCCLSLALYLCRPFSRWASVACRLLSLFLCLSLALFSNFLGMTIQLIQAFKLRLIVMAKNLEKYYNTSDNTDTETISASVFVFIDSLVVSALQDSAGYAISCPNNLELHLGYHTCWLTYFTLVCLWCGQTVGCSVGRCTVTWLPNVLGWVDLLSYGTPQSRDSRARRAPLLTELIYTFRDGLNFGEGIVNIQLATTALIQVSLYFSAALLTRARELCQKCLWRTKTFKMPK